MNESIRPFQACSSAELCPDDGKSVCRRSPPALADSTRRAIRSMRTLTLFHSWTSFIGHLARVVSTGKHEIMVRQSIAQSLPSELLEMVLQAVVQEEYDQAHVDYDAERKRDWNKEREERLVGRRLEKDFIGFSTSLHPFLLVCRRWHQCVPTRIRPQV